MSLEELKKDAEEFAKLIAEAKRSRVKNVLTVGKAELDKEIVTLELKARQQIATSSKKADDTPKRYLVELSEYAWDQSEKFIKLFITLDGVQQIDESNVSATFDGHSFSLRVSNLNGKDYGLSINNLMHEILPAKSYHKVKTDLIAIYVKKLEEGRHWDALTTVGKRLKEKQDSEMKAETENSEDALVNIMKKMYQSGDPKTKAMIAKAWTESQEKAMAGDGAGPM